jgi:hypothetical protein
MFGASMELAVNNRDIDKFFKSYATPICWGIFRKDISCAAFTLKLIK